MADVCPNCDLIEKEVERLRESEKFFADRCGDAELKLLELQRKYDALVDEITGRSLHRPDGLICFDPNELRALLEDDDEELDGTMECHLAMKNAGLL